MRFQVYTHVYFYEITPRFFFVVRSTPLFRTDYWNPLMGITYSGVIELILLPVAVLNLLPVAFLIRYIKRGLITKSLNVALITEWIVIIKNTILLLQGTAPSSFYNTPSRFFTLTNLILTVILA